MIAIVVKEIAMAMKQRQKTVHYALTYLDLVMCQANVFSKKFDDQDMIVKSVPPLRMSNNLLASTCILLASKFYEPDDNLIMTMDI